MTDEANQANDITKKRKKQVFKYGNYNRYYGYRNKERSQDIRLACFEQSWFEGKQVLDIGCNTGQVTLTVAQKFRPSMITGIDIDANLIQIARSNVKHYLPKKRPRLDQDQPANDGPQLLLNVQFRTENFVPESDDLLSTYQEQFDCILALSVTKWIHLNWGDQGLKRFFKRIYAELKPGGLLILEPQPWSSYKSKKKLTETIHNNFKSITIRPNMFNDLLTKEIGFGSFELVTVPDHCSKGFKRPIYLFWKELQQCCTTEL